MSNTLLLVLYIIIAGVGAYTQNGTLYYRCPKGFSRAGNMCYYLSEEKASWREAHFKCQDMAKSTLAVPDKKMQDKYLRYKLNRKKQPSFERWIGGKYDSAQNAWVWGTTGKKVRYQAFSRRRHQTSYDWQCIVVDPQRRNRWDSRSCLEEKYFICEHPLEEVIVDRVPVNTSITQPESFVSSTVTRISPTMKPRIKRYTCPERFFLVGNNCYHVSREKVSWREANFNCGEMDKSNLAILDTELIDQRLRNALKRRRKVIEESWIGGIYNFQRQIWIWGHTGCSIWYQDFLKNKTQINKINEGKGWFCITLDPSIDYRWSARGCFEHRQYICERPAKRLRVMGGSRNDYRKQLTAKQRIDPSLCDINNTL